MSIGLEDRELLIRCSCGNPLEHIALLIHEPQDSRDNVLKAQGDDWYLMVTLEPCFSFWKRLSVAFRYLFGMKVGYWGYVELVLNDSDVDAIAAFIQKKRSSVAP